MNTVSENWYCLNGKPNSEVQRTGIGAQSHEYESDL